MSKPRITPKPETDLPRREQAIPQGTHLNVSAPQFDPIFHVWRWPEPEPWAGLPQSERKERRR